MATPHYRIKRDPNSTCTDYIVINEYNITVNIIAKNMTGKGYYRFQHDPSTKEWTMAQHNSWFPTLRDVKKYYGIEVK